MEEVVFFAGYLGLPMVAIGLAFSAPSVIAAVDKRLRARTFTPCIQPVSLNPSFRPLGSDFKPEHCLQVDIDERIMKKIEEKKFFLVHGAKTMGKSTFMREFVRRRQDAGDFAFYVQIDKDMMSDSDVQTRDAIYPSPRWPISGNVRYSSADHWEIIERIIQRKRDRTYIIIDDAHQLCVSDKWDRRLVMILRELHELYGISVIFVSDVDDPWQGTDVSQGFQLFPETMRFEPSTAPLSETLSKVGLQKAHIDAILNATGACVGDVAKILDVVHDNSGRDTTLNESVKSAIDSVCTAEYGRIDHIATTIDSGSSTTALLQQLSANEQGILELAHKSHFESYANRLTDAGIVGRSSRPRRFAWAKPLSKLAYKTYGPETEVK